MATFEQRLLVLDRENRARKASYQIAGGKVTFTMQASPIYHKIGNNNTPVSVRVKFQPDKINADGISLTTLSAEIAYDNAFIQPVEDATSYNEPQSGDGLVVINMLIARVPYSNTDYYIRVTSSGPSSGTFTLL